MGGKMGLQKAILEGKLALYIMGCIIGLIIGCAHDRVITAVGNKVDTKNQNCVCDVRRFIMLINLVTD